MRTIRPIIFFCLLLSLLATALAQDPNTAKANDLIKQAREAIGGEANLKAIQSFVVEGKYKGALMGRPTQGDLKIEMLLPDKYLRTATMSMGMGEMTILQCVNAEQVWMDRKLPQMGGGGGDCGGRGGGGGGRGGGGGGGMSGGRGGGVPGGDFMNNPGMQRQVRNDYNQLMLAWLLTPPTNLPVEYLYERDLDAKDGKVDVVRVTGPENFLMWLLLDQKTHRPAGYVYRTMQSQRPANVTDAREATEPKPIDVQVFFADYKPEGNIQLPHQITKISNNQLLEEVKINKIKFNEKLKDKKFEKKS